MSLLEKHAGLYTDHYELTMAQGYFLNNMKDIPACFDYFFRKNPFAAGMRFSRDSGICSKFSVGLRYDDEDCNFLKSIGLARSLLVFSKNSSSGPIYTLLRRVRLFSLSNLLFAWKGILLSPRS